MPNAKFLMEREAGYAVDTLGFPSIKGCIAIALQTKDGIFGFHNAGNSARDKFEARARKWSEFVQAHPKSNDPALALYGITFARCNERGYSLPPVDNWKAELRTFATHLNFLGPIFGYDLTQTFNGPGKRPSAYVLFRREGGGYSIFVREWYDDQRDGVKTGSYTPTADYKNLDSMPSKMVVDVGQTGLTRVFPERLGGQ